MNLTLKKLKNILLARLCCFIIRLFCVFVVASVTSAATIYSEIDKNTEKYNELEQLHSVAFIAYLDEDYQTAYQNWEKAAKKKHARSFFNLALMHDRGQVPNGKSSKALALDFFKRAANGNYLPAYHYWARIVEKDSPELAKRIRSVLNENSPNAQQVDIRVTSQEKKPAPTTQLKSEESNYLLREDWVSQQHDQDWTIQIVAYRDEEQLLGFVEQHKLSENAAYFMETTKDKAWYKLIVGSFSSKQAADQARYDLPASVQNEGPWLRQFKSIKTAIQQSN